MRVLTPQWVNPIKDLKIFLELKILFCLYRRVNDSLEKFHFENGDIEFEISDSPNDYIPGDIVSWNLGGNTTHIGVIVSKKSSDNLENHIKSVSMINRGNYFK